MNDILAHVPLVIPPPGTISNFINPASRATLLIVPNTVSLALMLLFVSLRIYSKVRHHRSFDGSDYACVLATILVISSTAVTLSTLTGPFGKHDWDVPLTWITSNYSQRQLFIILPYSPAIFFTKLSLFLLYLRVFSIDLRTRYLIYFGIGFMAIFYSIMLVYVPVACTPRRGLTWHQAWVSSRCKTVKTASYSQNVINILGDFYLLGLPMPVVWKLQMPLRKKVGVSAIFLLGTLASICSILNLYYRVQLNKTDDNLWALVPVEITSIVEINVGIICGCLPPLASMLESQLAKTYNFFHIRSIKPQVYSLFMKCYHYCTYPWREAGLIQGNK